MLQYNRQTDPRWADKIMTEGTDAQNKSWKDKLRDYGCLVTCCANIHQQHSNIEFTPEKLNRILREHKGYYWLSGKTQSESSASFMDWDIFTNLFVCKKRDITDHKEFDFCKNDDNIFYIARIVTNFGGHYINVLRVLTKYNQIIVYDVYSDIVKVLGYNEITKLIEVKFRGY